MQYLVGEPRGGFLGSEVVRVDARALAVRSAGVLG